MSDPTTPSNPGGKSVQRVEQSGRPPMPRWVKVSGIIFIAVVLLLIAVAILSGGEHGPGRHAAASGPVPSQQAVPALQ